MEGKGVEGGLIIKSLRSLERASIKRRAGRQYRPTNDDRINNIRKHTWTETRPPLFNSLSSLS